MCTSFLVVIAYFIVRACQISNSGFNVNLLKPELSWYNLNISLAVDRVFKVILCIQLYGSTTSVITDCLKDGLREPEDNQVYVEQLK